MELARIKNGFLSDAEGGYRDLKINVVFQSTSNPEVRMICEVQLILNQYLYEKKKMHKLYSIIRDEIYYEMASAEEELDLKALQFEPILNAHKEFGDEYGDVCYKGAVQTDPGLLTVVSQESFAWSNKQCLCVDMESKKVVFKTKCHADGCHANHWVTFENRLFLSVPTKKNVVSFFAVDSVSKQLSEDDALKIVLPESDNIDFVEFDNAFENVFIIKNGRTLEKRLVGGGDEVTMSLRLNTEVESGGDKNLSLSEDGKFCAIGGGWTKKMWHLVDIATQQQYELESKILENSFTPCFIGGGSQLIAVGGGVQFEIWDLNQREAINAVEFDGYNVGCMCSTGNILAMGSADKNVRLYDTRSWELLLTKHCDMIPKSLHLTTDLRYLTVGGLQGEQCVVLKLT